MKCRKLYRPALITIAAGLGGATVLAQQAMPLFADGIDDWSLINAEAEAFSFDDGVMRVSGDKGSALTVALNGEVVLEAGNLENPRGHIGFQSETGLVEYRNLVIRER